MDHDLLIAYGTEGLIEACSILLLLILVGVLISLRRNFEGSFFVESVLLFILLSAGAIMLLLLATNLASPD
jgi:multisubunit Na+/H+ antiporter MnhB subunit